MKPWLWAMAGLLVAFVLLQVVGIVLVLQDRSVPDVLELPEVSVQNRVSGVEGPALEYPSQTVLVLSGERCNTSDVEVPVTSTLQWVTTDPRTTVLTEDRGIESLEPGCQEFSAQYPVPDIVVTRTRELATSSSSPLPCVDWVVTGVLAPAPGVGMPERWVSEIFCVYVTS